MAYSNGIVTAPVRTQDVATALGFSETRVGKLCTYYDINPWAKYKPVQHPKLTALTEADRKSVSYGINNIPLFTSHINMAQFMSNGSPNPLNGPLSEYWKYEYPGEKDPKRLGDFNGYWDFALPFIYRMIATEVDVRPPSSGSPQPVNFDFPVATADANLKISDFDYQVLWNKYDTVNSGARYYMGVCITDGTEAGTRLVTQAAQINNGSLTTTTVDGQKCVRISVPYDEFMENVPPAGYLTVFPFVTDYVVSPFAGPGGVGRPAIPFTMAKSLVRFITGHAFLVTWGQVTVTSPSMNTRNIVIRVLVTNQSGNNLYIDTTKRGSLTLKNSQGSVNQTVSLLPPNIEIMDGQTYTAEITFSNLAPSSYTASLSWSPYTGENHLKTKTIDIS